MFTNADSLPLTKAARERGPVETAKRKAMRERMAFLFSRESWQA
jgi:hypothetical protein